MILWGWRTTVRHLATAAYMCGQTGRQAGYAVLKRVTKFTLFFIPLFPLSVKYTLECSICGESRKISREDADQIIASQAHGHAQHTGYPQQQQQPYPVQQQHH